MKNKIHIRKFKTYLNKKYGVYFILLPISLRWRYFSNTEIRQILTKQKLNSFGYLLPPFCDKQTYILFTKITRVGPNRKTNMHSRFKDETV